MADRHHDSPNRAMVLAAGLGTRMRPFNGHDAEAAGHGRRQGADRLRARPARRRRASSARWSTCITSPTRSSATSHGRKRPQIVISDERGELLGTGGGVVKALPQLGDEPFFHVNSDTIWIDGVKPNLGAARRGLRSRAHGRAAAAGADRDRASAMPAAAISRWRRTAGSRGAASARWCRSSMPAPRSSRPRFFAGAPAGRLLDVAAVRPRRRSRAAATACGSKASGCMSARPTRSTRPRRRSSPARRDPSAGRIRRAIRAAESDDQRDSESAHARFRALARAVTNSASMRHGESRASSPFRPRRRSCRR